MKRFILRLIYPFYRLYRIFFHMKRLRVRTPRGELLLVQVRDRVGRALGLSYRSRIPADGMIFQFDKSVRPLFHMAGMRFPLDIIFLDHENIIVYIAYNQQAGSQNPNVIPPMQVEKVIEISAMRSDMLGLQVGEKLKFLT